MLLIVFAVLLTGAVGWALARPLMRPQAPPEAAQAFNAAVYRDQLDEIGRDVARGVLGEAEAAAARAEIERRLLTALQKQEAAAAATPKASKAAAALVAAGVAIAAGGVYLTIGDPAAPDQPLRTRAGEGAIAGGDPMHGQMDDLVRQLEAKLKQTPDDAQGWALMARSLARLDRPDDALAAYRRAMELTGGTDGALAAEYAEMRVIANDGVVDAESVRVFTRMLRETPGDPQARYYLALAKTQAGDVAGGLADWRALLADSPLDAPWRPTLEAKIAEASGQPAPGAQAPGPQAPRGPTKDQVDAAGAMSAGERTQMIEGMVAGLAERLKSNPDDVDGWRRLARAYDVLGRSLDAERAHTRVLALAPNDPAALWALGQYAKARGDAAEARRRFQALDRALPPDAPERAQVREALASVK